MSPEGRKIEEYEKILKSRFNVLFMDIQICFMRFFHILQFCDLQGTFWPLKSICVISLPYFELEVL